MKPGSAFKKNAGVILGAGLVLGVLGAGVRPLLAQQDPPPPEPRLKNYYPDETTCQGDSIRSGFAKNLLPWADQPEPVLASLRQVQAEMTRATLASCVSQKLMTPAQAAALQKELGLGEPPGAETQPQPSGSGASNRP
jgi:hypothetical protein